MQRLCAFLVSLFLTLPVAAQSSPASLVNAFYTDYTDALANHGGEWMKTLMANQAEHVEKPLSDMLVQLANGDPNKNEPFLDFDPFSNSQTGIGSYSLGKTATKDGLAYVPVSICYDQVPGSEVMRLRFVLRKSGPSWKIANVVYPAESGMKGWDLKTYLQEELRR